MALLNRKAFYDAIRGGKLFSEGFTKEQVSGMENLLNVWEDYFAKDSDFLLAYNLGTAYHETAHTMQPIKERGARSYFNKYEPGTKLGKMLGNTQPGDGYRYLGEGHVQNTGRANALKATRRINEVFGLNVDLVKNPDQRGNPFVSAISLFLGNKEGWWTGKDLLDFIDGVAESEAEDLREFVESRRVVNGTDKAAQIADGAMVFYKALQAARGAKATPAPQPDLFPVPTPPAAPSPPPPPPDRLWATAPSPPAQPLSFWQRLFGRK